MQKRLMALLVVLTLICTMTMMSGCAKKESAEGNKADLTETGEKTSNSDSTMVPAENLPVRFIIPGEMPQDAQLVLDAINKKMQADKVNLTLSYINIPWDAWGQKTNLMLSTGEEFEILPLLMDSLSLYAGKNGIIPIDQYIDQYGAEMKKLINDWAWKGTKINGKIYGVPALWMETAGASDSIMYRKDLFDKYGLSAPKTPEEFISSIETINNNEHAKEPVVWAYLGVEPTYFLHRTFDTYPFSVVDELFYVDQQGNVKSWIETDEFKKDCQFIHTLYEKKFIPSDILSTGWDIMYNDIVGGNFIADIEQGLVYSSAIKQNVPSAELDVFKLSPEKPDFRMKAFLNINMISSTSKNPEAGVIFLNWMYSSQDNYDLMAYGVKDQTWVDKGNKRIEFKNPQAPTYTLADWMIGHLDLIRFTTDRLDKDIQLSATAKNDAINSILIGFNFDPASVSVEYANLLNEFKTSIWPIKAGVITYEEGFAGALEKMKAAGLDKVVEEYAKQLKAWLGK